MANYKSLNVINGVPKSFDFEYTKEGQAPAVFTAKFQPPSNGIAIKTKSTNGTVSLLHASFHKSLESMVDTMFTSKEGIVTGFEGGQKLNLHRPKLVATSIRMESGDYVVKQYSAGFGDTIVS